MFQVDVSSDSANRRSLVLDSILVEKYGMFVQEHKAMQSTQGSGFHVSCKAEFNRPTGRQREVRSKSRAIDPHYDEME